MGSKGLMEFATPSRIPASTGVCRWLALILLLGLLGCSAGDNRAVEGLEVEDVQAYWSVWGKKEGKNYIHPAVRFKIRNKGESEADYVQTQAVFRRENKLEEAWGNAFEYALAGDPIPPGGLSREITLKSDVTVYSTDPPNKMLENDQWQQVFVEVFLRVGSSNRKSVVKLEVPKRLGAAGLEKFLEPQEPEATEEEAPKGKEGQ